MSTSSQLTEHRPGPEEAVVALIQDEAQRNHGALPVRVVSHDKMRNSVTVELLIRLMINQEPRELQPIPDVPIRWTSSITHAVTLPLPAGSLGWITPAGGDVSAWFANATAGSSDIEDQRFDLSDSVFAPGSRPFTDPLPAAALSDTDGVLYGPWQVGSSAAAAFVALANLTKAALDALQAAHDGHVHGGVTPGPGTTAVPSLIVGPLADVAATKLRAE